MKTRRKKQFSQRRKRAGSKTAKRPSRVERELARVFRQLRPNHPNLLAVGIGLRRKGGRVHREKVELVLRCVVKGGTKPASKRLPLEKGLKRLPPKVLLKRQVFGHTVAVPLKVDVEEVTTGCPMQFRVFYEEGSSCASAYARLKDEEGVPRIGVICCSHGVPVVGKRAGVEGKMINGAVVKFGGKVVARSDIDETGLDVALVMLDKKATADQLNDAGPSTQPCLSRTTLVDLIGASTQDGKVAQALFWTSDTASTLAASAYYDKYPIDVGGNVIELKSVVEFDGTSAPFQPGKSGSMLAVRPAGSPSSPVAIASHAANEGRRCFATHLDAAIEWLRDNGYPDLNPVWLTREL